MKFNKRAFTLIEILIASIILAMFVTVIYKLYFGVSRSFQKGSWYLNAQNKLRNALTFVREEMQKASFKTEVGLNGVTGDEADYPFKVAKDGEITNGTIATWFICIPFVTYEDKDAGAVYECKLQLSGGNLIYSKVNNGEGKDSNHVENPVSNYVIIRNVSKIEVSSVPFDPDKINKGTLVTLKVEVRHPDNVHFANTHVVAETGAKIELKVVNL